MFRGANGLPEKFSLVKKSETPKFQSAADLEENKTENFYKNKKKCQTRNNSHTIHTYKKEQIINSFILFLYNIYYI